MEDSFLGYCGTSGETMISKRRKRYRCSLRSALGTLLCSSLAEGTCWYLLALLFATVPTVPTCPGKEYSSISIRKQRLILAASFCAYQIPFVTCLVLSGVRLKLDEHFNIAHVATNLSDNTCQGIYH